MNVYSIVETRRYTVSSRLDEYEIVSEVEYGQYEPDSVDVEIEDVYQEAETFEVKVLCTVKAMNNEDAESITESKLTCLCGSTAGGDYEFLNAVVEGSESIDD